MKALAPVAAAMIAAVALAGCGGHEQPTVRSVVEVVPLALDGSQSVTIDLPARAPSTGTCTAPGTEVRASSGSLQVAVPPTAPVLPDGADRIIRGTTATYVAAPDGTATAYFERTLAHGPAVDVARFLGTALGRTSPVGATPVMTPLSAVLDQHDVYAAVLQSRAGAMDVPGPAGVPDWVGAGAAPDDRLVVVAGYGADPPPTLPTPAWAGQVSDLQVSRDGHLLVYTATTTDPCLYQTASARLLP